MTLPPTSARLFQDGGENGVLVLNGTLMGVVGLAFLISV